MPFGLGPNVSLATAFILVGGACGPEVCQGDLACGAQAMVDQTSLTAPIVSLTADPPCKVTQTAEVWVTVDGSFGADPSNSGSCQIHATLADGSTWVAVLSWAPDTSVCCNGSTRNVGPAPMFMRTDGGAP